MSVIPPTYDLTIPQRATFEETFTLPFDCTGKTVLAQVWNERHTTMLLAFETIWIDRAETAGAETKGRFKLRAEWEQTSQVTKNGLWDLLVIDDATGDRQFWLQGKALLDTGQTEELV